MEKISHDGNEASLDAVKVQLKKQSLGKKSAKVTRSDSWDGTPAGSRDINTYLKNHVEGKCRGNNNSTVTTWPLFHTETPPAPTRSTLEDAVLINPMSQLFIEKSFQIQTAVERICERTPWEYGEVWSLGMVRDQPKFNGGANPIQKLARFLRGGFAGQAEKQNMALISLSTYMRTETRDNSDMKSFATNTAKTTFPPGVGQPGRAIIHKQIEFLQDCQKEPYSRFQRRSYAIQAGFHSTLCVPILWKNPKADNVEEVAGVLVFFTRDVLENANVPKVLNETLQAMGECSVLAMGVEDVERLAKGAHSGATFLAIARDQDPSKLAVEHMLKCGICTGLSEDPMSLLPCMHTFCAECIENWARAFNNCPNCEVKMTAVKPNLTLRAAKDMFCAQKELQDSPVPMPSSSQMDSNHAHSTFLADRPGSIAEDEDQVGAPLALANTIQGQLNLIHAGNIKLSNEAREEPFQMPATGLACGPSESSSSRARPSSSDVKLQPTDKAAKEEKERAGRHRAISIASGKKPLLDSHDQHSAAIEHSDTWWEERAKKFKEEGKEMGDLDEPSMFANQWQKIGCINGIVEAFPGAMPALEMNRRALKLLAREGFKPEKTLFGNSTCPDEVNRVRNLWAHFTWGDTFNLGGLAGIPFTGKTGFAAFSQHMPDDGGLLVMYASHVGVSTKGQVGYVERHGMQECSKACGAAIGAYMELLKHPEHNVVPPSNDYQMWFVTRALKTHLKRIKASSDPQAEIPHVIYERIRAELLRMIPEDFKGKLALLGGIQINTPSGIPDYFMVKDFETVEYDNTSNMTLNSLTDRLNEATELENSVRGGSLFRCNSAETLWSLAKLNQMEKE